MSRAEQIERIEEAITELFSDMSVSKAETAEDLDGIVDFIDTMLDTFI